MQRKSVNFENISVKAICFNSLNLRGFLRSPDQIRRIASSIKRRGLINNPVVSMTNNGYLAVAGEQRILAHSYLANKLGMDQYSTIVCKVMEGITERTAMQILAEENFVQGTKIPAATANELYWHYRVNLEATQDHKGSLANIQETWGGNSSYIYYSLIIPGWLIYHTPMVQTFLNKVGSKREGLEDLDVQNTVQKIRNVRLNWWQIIASVYRPLLPLELLAPPSPADAQGFEKLMLKTFEVLRISSMRGSEAIFNLEKEVMPIRQTRLNTIISSASDTDERKAEAEKEIKQLEKMRKRRN